MTSTFRLDSHNDFALLTVEEQCIIREELAAHASGEFVAHVRLNEWHTGKCFDGLSFDSVHFLTYEEERNYQNSGGSWHYMDCQSYIDLINGKLE